MLLARCQYIFLVQDSFLSAERIAVHGLFVAILLQSSVLSKLHASEEELLLLQAFFEEGGFFAAPGKSAARLSSV
jgi:hypothetical protein